MNNTNRHAALCAVLTALVTAAGCATAPSTPSPATAPTTAAAASSTADVPAGWSTGPTAPPKTPTAQAKPDDVAAPTTGAAPAAAPPSAEARAAEGIDEQNWLPAAGPAHDVFLAAVETARKDPHAAVLQFVDAATRNPAFYAAWFDAAAAAEASGDALSAEKYYQRALEVKPDYGQALINLSLLLDRSGRSPDADRLIDSAVRAHGDKAGPHIAVATRAWGKHDLAQVEKEALAAIHLDERNVPAMRLMALMYASQGRTETARFALDNAIGLEPGNALLHFDLGQVALKLPDDKLALAEFQKAAKLRPGFAEAQENLGVLLEKDGRHADALKAFQEVARLQPASGRAQLHLGNGLRAVKQFVDAEAAYTKALQLDAALADAHFNLGLLYIDNALPGDELARLQKGVAELKVYRDGGKVNPAVATRLAGYIDATDKRIVKEQKKRERDERRKKDSDAAAAKPKATGSEGASPAPTPATPGALTTATPAPTSSAAAAAPVAGAPVAPLSSSAPGTATAAAPAAAPEVTHAP